MCGVCTIEMLAIVGSLHLSIIKWTTEKKQVCWCNLVSPKYKSTSSCRPHNSRWLLGYCFISTSFFLGVIESASKQHCSTYIWRPIGLVFVYTKCSISCCSQLVLLTMANLTRTVFTDFFLLIQVVEKPLPVSHMLFLVLASISIHQASF